MIEVLRAGTLTTVQDWPGRLGLWHVGVPPSGPMDDRSLRLGNRALDNAEGAPGLECTVAGPKLRFTEAAVACVCGAEAEVTLDGEPVERWQALEVPAGGLLDVGRANGLGLRVYVLVAGGIAVSDHLGSGSTFTLGRFGGYEGRALRKGDLLATGPPPAGRPSPVPIAADERPPLTHAWRIAVAEGPHAAPDFLTPEDVELFYATDWEVHFNSARTGVRLVGPRPRWARPDGGEAGLHPSNIHDTPYSVGAVDFTGDVPIVLGPDGPSLGGFVCPATVVTGERWKLGQLRPGDTPAGAADPHRPREAHIALIGHITQAELRHHATGVELANGFLNRFLIVACRRVRLLPEGGQHDPLGGSDLERRLARNLASAQAAGELHLDSPARELWWHIDNTRR